MNYDAQGVGTGGAASTCDKVRMEKDSSLVAALSQRALLDRLILPAKCIYALLELFVLAIYPALYMLRTTHTHNTHR